MLIVLILHPLLRRLYDSFWRSSTYTNVRSANSRTGLSHGLTADAAADARLEQRISFDLGFALIFIAALHGFSAFKVLFILYINYKIATALPHKYVPALSWLFNIGILFANELCRGYSYSNILGMLPGASAPSGPGKSVQNIGVTLDHYGGLVPRWEVLFNITILRLISFNMDHYWGMHQWSLGSRGTSPIEVRIFPVT